MRVNDWPTTGGLKPMLTDQAVSMWRFAPECPSLTDGEVHIWGASLDLPEAHIQALERLLTDEEREQAARFRFRQLSDRFIIARARLRIILGRYLDLAPCRVRFVYNTYGKPALEAPHKHRLRFNLSRSQGLVLFAIAAAGEVGIDVERVRKDVPVEEIAERFFSPAESAALRAFDGLEKHDVFFNYWVCKEAYVKALGKGLSFPLNEVEIELARKPVRIGGKSNGQASSQWLLCQLNAGADYKAALVAEGDCQSVECFWWQD